MLGDRPTAAIVDFDGTLCNNADMLHYILDVRPKNFRAYHEGSVDCPPHDVALDFAERMYEDGHHLIVVTARMWEAYEPTVAWLAKNMPVPWLGPFMRTQGDFRKDFLIKAELYDRLVEHYDIVAAIDDNPRILDLWERLGIPEVVRMPGWENYR